MKVKVTVDLGNYENISIESNEYESIDECKEEIDIALGNIREPRVDDFRQRLFGQR